MESAMDLNSGESRSGEAMSIFGQGINVRRPGRSRRRASQKILSPGMEQQARLTSDRRHHRRAVAERERARAEFELSRATTMATELERQIEQANAKANSHRSELQRTRTSGSSSSRRKKGLVDAEARGADQAQEESNTLYAEVMQELERVKTELRKLQREVKSAREAKATAERDAAETPTPSSRATTMSSDSRVLGSVNREAGGGASEERGIAELAEAGGVGNKATQMLPAARRTRGKGTRRGASRASDTDGTAFATASSSSDVLHRHGEVVMAMVRATTEETDHDHAVENHEQSGLTITRHAEHDDDGASRQAAEAELNSARTELASIREEGLRFATSIERTRKETARVTEEVGRLEEQEKRASAQVRQLNARLVRARARLDAATAADESAEATLAELSLALRQVEEETEAAEKEKALTELETRCVMEDAESVGAEIAAAERRVRQAVRELEAARAAEAAAAAKLKALVDAAMTARAAVTPQRSGNVTVPRFEYEYLTGRGEAVRAAAEKKVAAAEAWVEALQAGEKEMAMRADAIEREIGGHGLAGEAEEAAAEHETPRDGSPRAHPSRGPAKAGRASSATPKRKKSTGRMHPSSSSTSLARKPGSRKALMPTCMKLIARKCLGQN